MFQLKIIDQHHNAELFRLFYKTRLGAMRVGSRLIDGNNANYRAEVWKSGVLLLRKLSNNKWQQQSKYE